MAYKALKRNVAYAHHTSGLRLGGSSMRDGQTIECGQIFHSFYPFSGASVVTLPSMRICRGRALMGGIAETACSPCCFQFNPPLGSCL